MALTYSTGTVSVTAGGTSVVGSGTIWTGGNVSIDDDFVIDGVTAIFTTRSETHGRPDRRRAPRYINGYLTTTQ